MKSMNKNNAQAHCDTPSLNENLKRKFSPPPNISAIELTTN